MTADLAQRLRKRFDWLENNVGGSVVSELLREAADAIDSLTAERDDASLAAHANNGAAILAEQERDEFRRLHDVAFQEASNMEARLAAAELHLFSGHGCDCRHMAERRAAYLGTEKACGSFGCALPSGHNMGRADVPANHGPADLNSAKQEGG
jgi:hypothetical protein